jgi:prolyl-tRNA synthetase
MYPMFSLWVRSHTDLPLKVYQIVNTFRYETKQTRSFIRVREIHFFESHTCHTTEEDAQKQVEEDFGILERIAEKLCIPYTLLVRTEWDKFPGAYYTVGLDTAMPNGRVLQIGSIHHYRTNFSVPYDITYEDSDGEHKHVHQTTYGMSERLIGAMIGVHGDDKGLVLPPPVAPFQAVIIPILSKDNSGAVLKAAADLRDTLERSGIRVKLDDRDERPGSKFYDWEIRGVPLRLELGMRDIEKNVVTFVRRDNGEKGTISLSDISSGTDVLLESIRKDMHRKAVAKQKDCAVTIDSLKDVPERTLRFGWCGSEECGHRFEDENELKLLGTPYIPEKFSGKCIICGKETDKVAYASRSI